jgi:hypothetical protein
MSDAPKPELMSRRRVLSLLGSAGALGLAVPRFVLAASAAEARTIPPAFNQVDKPIPGERSTARTPPQPDKPILGEQTVTRRRRLRRKRAQEQRANRARRRSKPAGAQPPAGEDKPKWIP